MIEGFAVIQCFLLDFLRTNTPRGTLEFFSAEETASESSPMASMKQNESRARELRENQSSSRVEFFDDQN